MDKWLRRVHISARDFEKAERFVKCAMEHDIASIEHEAALLSAIVCYGKPFSGNEVEDRATADSRLTGVDLKQVLGEDTPLHKHVVRLRMKVAAHSESEYNPVSLLAGEPEVGPIFVSRTWHPVNEQIHLESFARIAKTLAWKCRCILADAARVAHGAANSEIQPHL